MKALTKARTSSKLFKSTLLLNSDRVLARDVVIAEASILLQCRSQSTLFSRSSALLTGKCLEVRNFSADVSTTKKPKPVINSTRSTRIKEGNFTEEAKEIYDKLFESAIVQRARAPKTLTRSLIQKCQNPDDIKLLFNMLEKLREFRLSNLGIYENFDLNLCRDVTKACVRAKAIGYGIRTMSKHNVYGLTPTTGTVNELMRYSRKHNDTKLMVDIMQRIKKNGLVLQPITADLVFSICYDTDNWGLLKKYSGQFISAKVKLRPKAFQVWTDFATKKGDEKTLDRIKGLRAAATKKKSSSKLKTE